METKVVKAQKSRIALVIICIVAAMAIAASLIFLITTENGAEFAESFGFEKTAVSSDSKTSAIEDGSPSSSEKSDTKATQSYGYSSDSINEHVNGQRQSLDDHVEESKERFQELIGNR